MDFFFVEYRDPIVGLIVLTILILVVAIGHYFYKFFANKDEEKGLDKFIKKFEIDIAHKELLKETSFSLDDLKFLASVFTKSGEFEKSIQIYLIALSKTKDENEREQIFYSLGESYFKAGFLQKSADSLISALKIHPRNIKTLKLLKTIYLKLKRYDEVLHTLECLFELEVDTQEEKAFIKTLVLQNKNLNTQEKITKSLKFDANSSLLKRFIFENYKADIKVDFENIVDLLYKKQNPIFLEDEKYFELFYALNLIPKKVNFFFKDSKFKMLKILKDNDFKAKLSFSYLCLECKNQMPIFFYHCPICYEFNTCRIYYEVKDCEKD